MKQLITLVAFIALGFSANAQFRTTRQAYFGVQDASVTGYKTITVSDTAGATVDTIRIRPASSITDLNYVTTDSAAINLYSLASCYKGDEIHFWVTNGGFTNALYLTGSFVFSTGTGRIALTANKSSMIAFRFDGVKFVEIDRVLNY